ncbi:hypothetical protein GCM10010191_10540 [Actinomadura vinacea]|uniref:HTH cro/C1-type domain-containing protein n=1 Tax=Actinomadura vinacea TaxID=115336 RepID=A0ABN3IIV9_9ACTN
MSQLPKRLGDATNGEFSSLLRALRERACLTQEELSERSGLSVRTISDLERGRTARPQRKSVALLAAALRIEGEALEAFRRLARRKSGSAADGALADERETVLSEPVEAVGVAGLVARLLTVLEAGPAVTGSLDDGSFDDRVELLRVTLRRALLVLDNVDAAPERSAVTGGTGGAVIELMPHRLGRPAPAVAVQARGPAVCDVPRSSHRFNRRPDRNVRKYPYA